MTDGDSIKDMMATKAYLQEHRIMQPETPQSAHAKIEMLEAQIAEIKRELNNLKDSLKKEEEAGGAKELHIANLSFDYVTILRSLLNKEICSVQRDILHRLHILSNRAPTFKGGEDSTLKEKKTYLEKLDRLLRMLEEDVLPTLKKHS